LNGVISLPTNFRNKKVEVIVFLNEENTAMPKLTMKEIYEMLKGSITESLIGSVPQSNMTLQDYRSERLKKYKLTSQE
jgi:CMP-N-acetylneuraminic acid synthetase